MLPDGQQKRSREAGEAHNQDCDQDRSVVPQRRVERSGPGVRRQVQGEVPLGGDGSPQLPRGGLHVRPAVLALGATRGARESPPACAEPPQGEVRAAARLRLHLLHQP